MLDERRMRESLARLIAAGLVESYMYDAATDRGVVRFTPACHRLLMAGRMPSNEPGFIRAWLTRDPAEVRAWLERAVAALDAETPDAPGPGDRAIGAAGTETGDA